MKKLTYSKINRMKQEKQLTMQRQCTFSPEINSYHSQRPKSCTRSERWLELYQSSRIRPSHRTKSRESLLEEQSLAECTFAPDLSKDPRWVRTAEYADPLVGRQVERMRRARAERDRTRQMLERSADGDGPMRFDLNRNKYSRGTFDQFRKLEAAKNKGTSRQKSVGGTRTEAAPRAESRKVILNIEVNMGDCQEWIAVREGDTPAGLASEFALRHRMD